MKKSRQTRDERLVPQTVSKAMLTFPRCFEAESDIQLSVSSTIADLPSRALSLLDHSKPWLRPDYFRMLETIQEETLAHHYVTVEIRGEVKALLYFQEVPFGARQLEAFIPDGLSGGFRSALRMFLRQFKTHILVSGNLFMTGDRGMYFHPESDSSEMAAVLSKSVRTLLTRNSRIGAYLLSDCYRMDEEWSTGLKSFGFHQVPSEPDMVVHLPGEWATGDDYKSALKAKYRTRLHRTLKLSSEIESRFLTLEQTTDWSTRLYDLYANVVSGVKLSLASLPPDYFVAQKALDPDGYQIRGYLLGGQLIGFTSYYFTNHSLEVHYIGWQSKIAREAMLYERMLYDSILLGIESGVGRIHFGRTAAEVKSTMGAVPMPMHGFVYHVGKIRNRVLALMAKTLKVKEQTLRHPFK